MGSAARRRRAPSTASPTSAECSSARASPPRRLPSGCSRSGTSPYSRERRLGRGARGTSGCATPPSRRSWSGHSPRSAVSWGSWRRFQLPEVSHPRGWALGRLDLQRSSAIVSQTIDDSWCFAAYCRHVKQGAKKRPPAAVVARVFLLRLEMPATIASPPLTARPLRCRGCGTERAAAPTAICEECLGPLDPVYEPGRPLPDREIIAGREPSLWRYKEWLPFDGDPVWSLDTGFTPLVDAPALARRFGVARVWVKNDTVSHPSLSFKDRVVAAAINAAAAFGLETIGCASTGNLANAVAAHAARAGLKAWIFIPDELEAGKVIGTSVYGARLIRVRGTYDDVNRLCAQVADRFGWGIVNVNLRSYYGEGSKTVAYEIAEQLGWRLPTAVVAPMAGGSLLSKLRKGFGEFVEAGLVRGRLPRLYGAQAAGCAPIVRLVERGGDVLEPEVPQTICRSLAIGSPADGVFAALAMRETGGTADR